MRVTRSVVIMFVGPLLATAGAVGAHAAPAAQSAPLAQPPSGNVLAAGEVSRSTGALNTGTILLQSSERQGVIAGASVKLIWYPGLDTAATGDVITPVVLSAGRTDVNGRYQLTATPNDKMVAEANRNDGWVNFQLTVDSASGTTSQNFSRAWHNHAWSTKERQDLAGPVNVQYVYDTKGKLLNGTSKAVNGVATATTATAYGCQYVIDTTYRLSTRLGQHHNASNADSYWQYGTTADSDIDVGAKSWGSSAWSISGSAHVGNSLSTAVTSSHTTAFHAWIRTDMRYQKGHIQDYYGAANGSTCSGSGLRVGDQKTAVQTWAGGVGSDTQAGAYDRGCIQSPMSSYRGTYPAGTGLTISSSRATRSSVAVSTPYLNLGGTSGYSTKMDMHWDSKRGRGVWLCGITGDEATNPGIIHSQNIV